MLRATMSTRAPASAARTSSAMISGSVSAFTFTRISARSPAAAAVATDRMSSTSRGRSVSGATSSLRNF